METRYYALDSDLFMKLHLKQTKSPRMLGLYFDGWVYDEIIAKYPKYRKQAFLGKLRNLKNNAERGIDIKERMKSFEITIQKYQSLKTDSEIKEEISKIKNILLVSQ